jgi:AbrB family looped-hinge helix DNA binding protein
MTPLATITSKRQLTIPVSLFKKAGLSKGDKVVIEEKEGNIILKPALSIVEKLADSVSVPKHLKGVNVDKAIKIAKDRYFGTKKQ